MQMGRYVHAVERGHSTVRTTLIGQEVTNGGYQALSIVTTLRAGYHIEKLGVLRGAADGLRILRVVK